MNTPTSEQAKRLARLMHRKLDTHWSSKEIKKWREVAKNKTIDTDLDLLERYYAAERKKGDKGMHRRDLQTLLNNWPSELDRAQQWEYKQPRVYRPKPQGPGRQELSEERRLKNLEEIRKLSEQLKQKLTYSATTYLSV